MSYDSRSRSNKWDCRFCTARRWGMDIGDALSLAKGGEWGNRITRMHSEYHRRRA